MKSLSERLEPSKLIIVATLMALLGADTAFADDAVSYELLVRWGGSAGGDDVASWTETWPSQAAIDEWRRTLPDGVELSTTTMETRPGNSAGNLLFGEVGVNVNAGGLPWSIEVSYGAHTSSIIGYASDTRFELKAINFIPAFHFGRHAVGLGLIRHKNIKFIIPLASWNNDYDYEDEQLGSISPVSELRFKESQGALIQYTYGKSVGRHRMTVGVRATFINYQTDVLRTLEEDFDTSSPRPYSRTISGNNIGLFVQYNFRVI